MFEALLNTLAWNLLVAALLAAALWLAGQTRWLRNRPAIRHALWLLVFLKMVTPPIVGLPILPYSEQRSASQLVAVEQPVVSHEAIGAPGPSTPTGALADQPGPPPSNAGNRHEMRRRLVFAGLAASLLGTLVILAHALRHAIRTIAAIRPLSSSAGCELQLVSEVAGPFGLKTAPVVWLTGGRVSPLLLGGLFHPRLVLPVSLVERLDDDQLRHVVAHELAHFVRRDHLTNLLAFLATAVFWWYPVAWLARREARSAAEACCDSIALARASGSRKAYAQTLLTTVDFLSHASPPPPIFFAGFGESQSLKQRFELIADPAVNARFGRAGCILLGLGVFAAVIMPSRAATEKSRISKAPSGDKREKSLTAEDPVPKDERKDEFKSPDTNHFVVHGTIFDQAKEPLAGVEVMAFCGSGTLRRTGITQSDANGHYTLRFGPGLLTLRTADSPQGVGEQAATVSPRLAGWYEANLHRQGNLMMTDEPRSGQPKAIRGYSGVVTPDHPFRLDFVMAQGATIKGRLVNEFGRPITGESISLDGDPLPPSSSVLDTAQTDRDGRFQFEGVPLHHKWKFTLRVHGIRHELSTESVQFDEPRQASFKLILDSDANTQGAIELKLSLRPANDND